MTHETQHGAGDAEKNYQPLTARQCETLDFLLSIETRGVEELRRQADAVLAKRWDCGAKLLLPGCLPSRAGSATSGPCARVRQLLPSGAASINRDGSV
jgi:hypothetical protein